LKQNVIKYDYEVFYHLKKTFEKKSWKGEGGWGVVCRSLNKKFLSPK